jgi:hypothetical protein
LNVEPVDIAEVRVGVWGCSTEDALDHRLCSTEGDAGEKGVGGYTFDFGECMVGLCIGDAAADGRGNDVDSLRVNGTIPFMGTCP